MTNKNIYIIAAIITIVMGFGFNMWKYVWLPVSLAIVIQQFYHSSNRDDRKS